MLHWVFRIHDVEVVPSRLARTRIAHIADRDGHARPRRYANRILVPKPEVIASGCAPGARLQDHLASGRETSNLGGGAREVQRVAADAAEEVPDVRIGGNSELRHPGRPGALRTWRDGERHVGERACSVRRLRAQDKRDSCEHNNERVGQESFHT